MTIKTGKKNNIMIIANPVAGGNNLRKRWKRHLEPFLTKHLLKFDHKFTRAPGHATLLTREAIKAGYRVIVSMGGDGTLNEVVNGFFENGHQINPKTELGILPFGSGGDFIRTLKIERNYEKTIKRIKSKKCKKVDVGRVRFRDKRYNDRYFINIAEIGLGAAIMKHVNAKNRLLPALVRYLTGTFQGILKYKNIPVTLNLFPRTREPGNPRTKSLMSQASKSHRSDINLTNLIVANGQYFGRGMRPAPHAKLDDGVFDVVVIKDITLLKFLLHFPQMYTKKKLISSKVLETYQAHKVSLKALNRNPKLKCEVDGETYGQGDMTLQIIPGAIKVRV